MAFFGIKTRKVVMATAAGALLAGTAAALLLPAVPARAAAAGATSAESATVSVTIPERVKLSGLTGATDFQFGNWDPDGATDEVGALDLCAWSNDGTPSQYSYQINATSANESGTDFRMTAGGNFLVYQVYWADAAGVTTPAGADQLDEGTADTSFAMPGANNPTCSTSGDNASLVVEVLEEDLSDATAGAYTDTLTITMGVVP